MEQNTTPNQVSKQVLELSFSFCEPDFGEINWRMSKELRERKEVAVIGYCGEISPV